MQKVYTASEVAEILKISYRAVLTLVKDGKLKSIDTNGIVRISEYQLDEYLKGSVKND